jgi:predicted alpha/beta hydrolase family esterase
LENSSVVIKYLINEIGFSEKNVYVIGRSIGTGPATHVASLFKKIGGLILISPFSSIKEVAS